MELAKSPPFAEPTALGLFGLAIGCASLLPLSFGVNGAATPDALRLTAWFCLLFGAGGQFLAGLMSFANKNMLGGTLMTTFSFNWVMNWFALSELAAGRFPNASVVLAVDVCFLVIFLAMTAAFGFYSKLLVAFLVDIDLLYIMRVLREVLHTKALSLPLGLATVVLMALALYIAIGLVLANASGRVILPMGGPLFMATPPPPQPSAAGGTR
jgi:uncharacterized protein